MLREGPFKLYDMISQDFKIRVAFVLEYLVFADGFVIIIIINVIIIIL